MQGCNIGLCISIWGITRFILTSSYKLALYWSTFMGRTNRGVHNRSETNIALDPGYSSRDSVIHRMYIRYLPVLRKAYARSRAQFISIRTDQAESIFKREETLTKPKAFSKGKKPWPSRKHFQKGRNLERLLNVYEKNIERKKLIYEHFNCKNALLSQSYITETLLD